MNTDDTIELLARRFPLAFFVDGTRRQPLKIGIIRDLVDADIGIPSTWIRRGLAAYTSSPSYLRACRASEERIDLAGEGSGKVSEEGARRARKRLERLGKAPERIEFTGKPRREGGDIPGPRRLTLADLKSAWLQKQRA
jgi:sRNA-binding protein